MPRDLEVKLGNGNILVIHDIDLENDNQAWYEEIPKPESTKAEY